MLINVEIQNLSKLVIQMKNCFLKLNSNTGNPLAEAGGLKLIKT